MEYLNNLFEKKNIPQLVLAVLFILYLILGFKMPYDIANIIDTNMGKIIIVILSLILFGISNPIVGILGVIVAYELIKRSSIATGTDALEKYYPTEEKKWSPFNARHQFPYTLEQEMVKKMAPARHFNNVSQPTTFKPILDDQHDAAPINYEGVI
jgi:hypothetical protein